MYTRWTQHLDTEEEKERFKKEIYAARSVLERMAGIIQEDYEALERSEEDQRIYNLPNWDYRQAHKNGIRQYMSMMSNLINLDHQKGTTNDQ